MPVLMCVLSQLDCYWQWIAVCLQSAVQSDFNLSRFLYVFFWLPKCLKPPKNFSKRTILCKVTVLVWTVGDSHWTCLLSVCCSDCSFSALLLEPKAAYTVVPLSADQLCSQLFISLCNWQCVLTSFPICVASDRHTI